MRADLKSAVETASAMIEEQALTREELLTYLRQMMEIRALENNIAELLGKAVLKGASHLYAGQEAVAVGAIAALRGNELAANSAACSGGVTPRTRNPISTPTANQATAANWRAVNQCG